MDDEQFQHLEDLRRRHQRRLRELERQVATFGLSTSPEIRTEIEDISGEIARIETELEHHLSVAHLTEGTLPKARQHNLPVPLTQLIGREQQIAAICALLRQTDIRLITLTGSGGTGKTRLALQVATDLADSYTHGACFIDLAPILDTNLVITTIAQALNLREMRSRPLLDNLKEHLRNQHILLVIDNFEQVIDAAPLLTQLLAAAPLVNVLVTSRAVLRISGEREFAVAPLAVPKIGQLPPLDDLITNEAIRLFVERVQAVRPDFLLTQDNASTIAQICARLDGLPLAIELAAARMRVLPPEALLSRLDQRLKLLTSGARDLPSRQQTLRNAIAWSYDLLTTAEQRLFTRLAVFVGEWGLAAAEFVCNRMGDTALDPLDGLQSLQDNSLIQQLDSREGELQFQMLETIREFALEQLEDRGETTALRRHHAAYYVELVGRAKFTGLIEKIWIARIEHAHDNLRAALGWATQHGEIVIAAHICSILWRFWNVRGYLTEGRRWCEMLIPQQLKLPAPLRASVLTGAAVLALGQGDFIQAQEYYEASLTLYQEHGDTNNIAYTLTGLGNVARSQGDSESARRLYETSLALRREQGDTFGIAYLLSSLGNVALDQSDYASAQTWYEESLTLRREQGDKRSIAYVLASLGNIALYQGEYATAQALYKESLALSQEQGDKRGNAYTLSNLANVAYSLGEHNAAQALYNESLVLHRELGDKRGIAYALAGLGNVYYRQGDTAAARRCYEEGLYLRRGQHDRRGIAYVLGGLALLARAEREVARAKAFFAESLMLRQDQGDRQRVCWCLIEIGELAVELGQLVQATRLFGAVDSVRSTLGAMLTIDEQRDYERDLATLRATLDESTFAAAWEAGRAMTLDQAVAEALEMSAGD